MDRGKTMFLINAVATTRYPCRKRNFDTDLVIIITEINSDVNIRL